MLKSIRLRRWRTVLFVVLVNTCFGIEYSLGGGLVEALPEQRLYAYGFSVLPPATHGWLVNSLNNNLGHGFFHLSSYEKNVYLKTIRSGVTVVPLKYRTDVEFLEAVKQSNIVVSSFELDRMGTNSPKIVSRKELLAPEYGEYCVKGEYFLSGIKISYDGDAVGNAQIISLLCVMPENKSIGVDTKFSQIYVKDELRKNINMEFDSYCHSIRFEKTN